jgi:acetyltransferase
MPSAVEECGKKGVKYCIIITGGFKEIGVEGAKMERKILETAKKYGMRLLGPNCFGMMNTSIGLNTTFSPIMPKEGNIAVFSQSGALCASVLDWAYREGVGFSKFINLGNKADLNENDFLEALEEDDETCVILGYLEGVVDGEKFIYRDCQKGDKEETFGSYQGRKVKFWCESGFFAYWNTCRDRKSVQSSIC